MTYLVERLVELRRYLGHARKLQSRVDRAALEQDLSLHNDVLFTLLSICQLVIDISGELSARRGDRFEDYTQAIRNLAKDPRFSPGLVASLERLPGFRNVIVHEYVELDLERAVSALNELQPVDEFLELTAKLENEGGQE
jgi:uncharacterized protein YutE (UPF0331/DUF86 family)